jgi:hypothetical protein
VLNEPGEPHFPGHRFLREIVISNSLPLIDLQISDRLIQQIPDDLIVVVNFHCKRCVVTGNNLFHTGKFKLNISHNLQYNPHDTKHHGTP